MCGRHEEEAGQGEEPPRAERVAIRNDLFGLLGTSHDRTHKLALLCRTNAASVSIRRGFWKHGGSVVEQWARGSSRMTDYTKDFSDLRDARAIDNTQWFSLLIATKNNEHSSSSRSQQQTCAGTLASLLASSRRKCLFFKVSWFFSRC